jgi:hypothetical protein
MADPSHQRTGLRNALKFAAGVAAAAALALTTWLFHFAPPWPAYREVAALTFTLGASIYTAAVLFLGGWDGHRLRRLGRWLLAASLAAGAGYSFLWTAFTYSTTAAGQRVVVGWSYTPSARDYLALNPHLSTEELLADMENDPDLVFDPVSLRVMSLGVLASWCVAVAALLGLLGVGALLGTRPALDPVAARLHERVAGWPPALDAELRAGMEQALHTLTRAGNVPGAILTVAGLLEGEHGLLSRVASVHGQPLRGGNLFAQIEELAQKGLVPGDILSDLHWVRLRSNMARHQKGSVTAEDAHTAIGRAAHVIEWYHSARTAKAGPPASASPAGTDPHAGS